MLGKIYIHNCQKPGSIPSFRFFLQLVTVCLALVHSVEIRAMVDLFHPPYSLENDSLVCCSDSTLTTGSIGETGVVTVTDEATLVTLSKSYVDPVVVTGGMNRSGAHLTTIRIQNLTSSQFEMRVIDWECKNPGHGPEDIPYMVVEAGVHTLSNGAKLIAQNFSNIDHTWSNQVFPIAFDSIPAIFGQVITENESSPVVLSFDQNQLQQGQFRMRIRESGIADGIHAPETVSMIAIEKGIYEYESMSMEVRQQPLLLDNVESLVTLERDNLDAGTFIGGIQSANSVVPASINFRFSTPNSVLMRLDFENCSGREDSIRQEVVSYINVVGQGSIIACISDTINDPPIAQFTASPVIGIPPLEVSFDASSSSDPDGTIESFFWNFGDGSTGSGALQTHTYVDTGSYITTLIVTDEKGLQDTSTVEIRVSDQPIEVPPLAVFTASPYEGDSAPMIVSFDASASVDLDGRIVSYQWNFGDGNSGEGATISHTFEQNGKYIVQLVVIDDQGLPDTSELIIRIGLDLVPPLAAFTVSDQMGKSPFPVLFDAAISSDPDGQIVSYSWSIGEQLLSDEASFVYEFETAGTFVVRLIIADDDNLSDTASVEITVFQGNTPPIAEFAYSILEEEDFRKVSFDASASQDPDGAIRTYTWNFGDGKVAEGKRTSHIFPSEGTYRVKLEVVDDSASSDTFSVAVPIKRLEKDSTEVIVDCKDSTWVIGEVGKVTATDQATRVSFKNVYKNPVVVTGGFRRSGAHHTTIRIQGLTPAGFDIRLMDWECKNPGHGPEGIAYMVIESGSYILPNGKKIMAGNYGLVTHEWGARLFPSTFDELPMVFAQCISENESVPVVPQIDQTRLTKEGFALRLRENRSSDTVHTEERVGVIALEPGIFNDELFSFETSNSNLIVGLTTKSFALRQDYGGMPVVLGAIQSTKEDIGATVHIRSISSDSAKFSLDYENCSSLDAYQLQEEISYIAFGELGDIYACGLGTGSEGEGGLENPETGPNNMPALRFELFPVPTREQLNLMLDEEGEIFEYQVINYAGQQVTEGRLQSGANVLNVEKLSPGIYLMNVYTDQAMSSLEFVVY